MTTILFLHGWHSVPGGVKPEPLEAILRACEA